MACEKKEFRFMLNFPIFRRQEGLYPNEVQTVISFYCARFPLIPREEIEKVYDLTVENTLKMKETEKMAQNFFNASLEVISLRNSTHRVNFKLETGNLVPQAPLSPMDLRYNSALLQSLPAHAPLVSSVLSRVQSIKTRSQLVSQIRPVQKPVDEKVLAGLSSHPHKAHHRVKSMCDSDWARIRPSGLGWAMPAEMYHKVQHNIAAQAPVAAAQIPMLAAQVPVAAVQIPMAAEQSALVVEKGAGPLGPSTPAAKSGCGFFSCWGDKGGEKAKKNQVAPSLELFSNL